MPEEPKPVYEVQKDADGQILGVSGPDEKLIKFDPNNQEFCDFLTRASVGEITLPPEYTPPEKGDYFSD